MEKIPSQPSLSRIRILGEGNLKLERYPNLRKHSIYHPNAPPEV